jgi:hypothetical protein
VASNRNRNPKPLQQKLQDLDAHLFLLREHLHKLRESQSHLKVIAAELRTLVCRSSGTDGLLLRLSKELGVSDEVALHLPGNLIQDHPLVQGLQFLLVPIFRAGKGDPRLVPDNYSLQHIIREGEAVVALGKPLTHEYLIKAVAQQMGSAHEDEGLEPALTQLSGVFINGVEPYVGVLATDAELSLEVGERVLETAETEHAFARSSHSQDYGNVSIVVRVHRKLHVGSRVLLLRFQSHISAVTILVFATSTGILFRLEKRGREIAELVAAYPDNVELGADSIAVLSYCSRTGEARTLTADGPAIPQVIRLGWLHAAELELEEVCDTHKEILEQRFVLTFQRLLSSRDVREILDLPPDGYGLWKPHSELDARGPFPE